MEINLHETQKMQRFSSIIPIKGCMSLEFVMLVNVFKVNWASIVRNIMHFYLRNHFILSMCVYCTMTTTFKFPWINRWNCFWYYTQMCCFLWTNFFLWCAILWTRIRLVWVLKHLMRCVCRTVKCLKCVRFENRLFHRKTWNIFKCRSVSTPKSC